MGDQNPSRRQFLTAGGSALTLALAGCSGGGETTTEGETTEGGKTTDGGDATTAASGGSETTEEGSDSSGGSFAIKVVYDGDWQGSISAGGSTRTVEGSGTETIEVSGEPSIISANAQKQNAGSGKKLTIQILKDDEVVKKSSTTADYGLAQATYSALDSGSTSGGSDSANLSVKVVYEDEWQGSISKDGSSRSIQGSGTETIDVKGSPSIISANAQKQNAGSGKKLTIQILKDGEVVKKASTTAEYGMAQVTVTL